MSKGVILGEAGKVFSKTNENKLRAAWKALKDAFTGAGLDPDSEDEEETEVKEALYSANDKSTRLMRAIRSTAPQYSYIRDIFDTFFVYQTGYDSPRMIAQAYEISDKGVVTLGSSVEVLGRTAYETTTGESLTDTLPVETSESATLVDLSSEIVPLTEAAKGSGTVPVKIIAPGKGSSGYYSSEVLKRDGPKVFRSGLPMYWNHASAKEEAERPEGDMSRLAAVLTEDAKYLEEGPEGAGLYARMKVFSDYADVVKEKAPYTGVSIKASGVAKMGEVAGVGRTPIVESIVSAKSVDFVTKAGAGGKALVELQESATSAQQEVVMPDQTSDEIKGLLEAQGREIKTLRESLVKAQANPRIAQAVATFPEAMRQRMSTEISGAVKLTESMELDTVALEETIKTVIEREAAFLTSLGLGGVSGMGGRSGPSNLSESDKEAQAKRIEDKIKSWG